MGIKFIVDQLSDLPGSGVNMSDISVVDNYVTLEKKNETPMNLSNLTCDNFRAKVDTFVQHGWVAKTSMPTITESEGEEELGVVSVERLTRELLKENDVVFLATNSTITGSYEAVSALYDEMATDGKFKNHRAICLDTTCAGTGLAFLIRDLLDSVPTSLEEVAEFVMNNSGRIGQVFTWRDLTYIKNSGKVSGPIAKLANLLKCYPVCSVEYVGDERPLTTLIPINRGYVKVAKQLAKVVSVTIEEPDSEIVVAHGDDEEFAQVVKREIYAQLPDVSILDWRCGPIIQAHGGPTSIHVNYRRKYPNSFDETKRVIGE